MSKRLWVWIPLPVTTRMTILHDNLFVENQSPNGIGGATCLSVSIPKMLRVLCQTLQMSYSFLICIFEICPILFHGQKKICFKYKNTLYVNRSIVIVNHCKKVSIHKNMVDAKFHWNFCWPYCIERLFNDNVNICNPDLHWEGYQIAIGRVRT